MNFEDQINAGIYFLHCTNREITALFPTGLGMRLQETTMHYQGIFTISHIKELHTCCVLGNGNCTEKSCVIPTASQPAPLMHKVSNCNTGFDHSSHNPFTQNGNTIRQVYYRPYSLNEGNFVGSLMLEDV